MKLFYFIMSVLFTVLSFLTKDQTAAIYLVGAIVSLAIHDHFKNENP